MATGDRVTPCSTFENKLFWHAARTEPIDWCQGLAAPVLAPEQLHSHLSMGGMAGLFHELRLQDLPQLQREDEDACQRESSSGDLP